jgi:hypothetical protein
MQNSPLVLTVTALLLTVAPAPVHAAESPDPAALAAAIQLFDPETIGSDRLIQGEYTGGDASARIGMQVVARGDHLFHALVFDGGLPGDGWNGARYSLLESSPATGSSVSFHPVEKEGPSAIWSPDGITLQKDAQNIVLRRTERSSPTLGMKPPQDAVILFGPGQKGTEAFEERKDIEGMTKPTLYQDRLMAGAVTKQRFKDLLLHVEFMTGWEPENIPWRRADAGIYLMSRYEVAIGDSFGFDFDLNGSGGPVPPTLFCEKLKASKFPVLTGARLQGAPRVCGSVFTYPSKVPNACLPPLVWQTLDIDFTAPRFGADGKKQSDATLSVRLNGQQTVEKLAVPRPTPHGFKGPEEPEGPIWFEAFGRRVLYRNIWAQERR